jgi:hypothetical protein
MMANLAALVDIDDALLARHPDVFGPDPASRMRSLGEALTSSRSWARLRPAARLAIRPTHGLLGIIGRANDVDRAALEALETQVHEQLSRLLPVPYPEVEASCTELAAAIRSELTPDELSRCRFEPVPRGGHIVAGFLAYALGLEHQPKTRGVKEAITLLIDDCAISGRRITSWLAEHPGRDAMVAVLHAAPELARRLKRDEPRIRHWFTARDLKDHAADRPAAASWRRTWASRYPGDPWIGEPDHVVYPWNEPDVRIWNPATSRGEAGWHVAPPAWCFKNRLGAHPEDVVVCSDGPGSVRPAPGVLWVSIGDGTIAIARRGDPEVLALRGSMASQWERMVATGDAEAVAERSAIRDLGLIAGG